MDKKKKTKNFFDIPKKSKKEDVDKLSENGTEAIQDFTKILTPDSQPVKDADKQPPRPLDDENTMFDEFNNYLKNKEEK